MTWFILHPMIPVPKAASSMLLEQLRQIPGFEFNERGAAQTVSDILDTFIQQTECSRSCSAPTFSLTMDSAGGLVFNAMGYLFSPFSTSIEAYMGMANIASMFMIFLSGVFFYTFSLGCCSCDFSI